MQTFKFKRTMQYTEEVEVSAETLAEAWEQAQGEDGVRNNDDRVINMEQVQN